MKFHSVNIEEWKEALITHPEHLAELPYTVQQFESIIGIVFDQYIQDGLGIYRGKPLRLNGVLFYVQGPIETDQVGAIISVLGNEREPERLLVDICNELDLQLSDLRNISEYRAGPKYRVIRLDDNGNEIEMEQFLNELSADSYAKTFEVRGHKQTYFVKDVRT